MTLPLFVSRRSLTDLPPLIKRSFSLSRVKIIQSFESFSHVSEKPKIVVSSSAFTSDLRSERFLAMLLQLGSNHFSSERHDDKYKQKAYKQKEKYGNAVEIKLKCMCQWVMS